MIDVAVIGGGPAGLAAAQAACEQGAPKVVLFERDVSLGGILRQCVHDGFGLVRFGESLTGPEYARRFSERLESCKATVFCNTMVTSLSADKRLTYVNANGVESRKARSVVLAMGCRERTRGAIRIPGTRPAGIFTAGAAQNMINLRNLLPGKRVVILGSGDIGLIMARRLTFEGAQVLAIIEQRDEPSGLQRNVTQCVYDFSIPLYTNHTITDIKGTSRLQSVTVTNVKDATSFELACDTLILSVGLIPENELSRQAGLALETSTGGIVTDEYLESSVPGIFACGNARSVLDLVDFVSSEAEVAGKNAALRALDKDIPLFERPHTMSLPKGFPDNTLTCTLCPSGCSLTIEERDGESRTSGHHCEKGLEFVRDELIAPKRTFTGTIKTSAGVLIPVRSTMPIPREHLLAAAQLMKSLALHDSLAPNTIVTSNILETGANIIVA